MTPPYYSVTITNVSQGWSYSAVHTVLPPSTDRVILIDPLTYGYAFDGEQIPSAKFGPETLTINLAARTAADAPPCFEGDLILADVRIGTTGPRILSPQTPFRVGSVAVALRKHKYAAVVTIAAADMSPDWQNIPCGSAIGDSVAVNVWTRRWLDRFAEIAHNIGVALGRPSSWPDTEGPAEPDPAHPQTVKTLRDPDVTDTRTAGEVLPKMLNSHQPGGYTCAWATVWSSGFPTGYRRIGPNTPEPIHPNNPITEPTTLLHVLAVPASRKASGLGLPLVFAWDGSQIVLTPVTPPAGKPCTQVAIDALWCELPVTARRDRTTAPNQVNISGQANFLDNNGAYSDADSVLTFQNAADVAARGVIARDVDTELYLGVVNQSSSWTWAEPAAVAGNFLADASTIGAGYAFDGFDVLASAIPDAVAAWLLPIMNPRKPGDTDGDGTLVRQVNLYRVASDKQFSGQPISAFVVAGTMTIAGGDIVWNLITTPGRPIDPVDLTPLTLAQVNAAAYGAHALSTLDPLITISDLALVDA